MNIASQVRSNVAVTRRRGDDEGLLMLEIERVRCLVHGRMIALRRVWRHDPAIAHESGVITEAEAGWLAGSGSQDTQPEHDDAFRSRLGAIDRRIAARASEMRSRGTASVLDSLCDAFGLEPFERHALVVAVAPALDPGLSRLYGYLQNDLSLCHPTPRLATDLFESRGPADTLAAFAPGSALRGGGLIELGRRRTGTGRALQPLDVPDRVVEFLLGIEAPDPEFDAMAAPCADPVLSPQTEARVERLARGLRRESGDDRAPRLVLLGRQGSGRAAVAAAILRSLGLRPFRLELASLPGDGAGRERFAGSLVREFRLREAGYLADLTDARGPDPSWMLAAPAPILFVAERPPTWERVPIEPVARPDAAGQRDVWRLVLGPGVADAGDLVTSLAERFDLGPAAIARIGRSARAKARLRSGEPNALPTRDDVLRACRERAGVDGLPLGKLIDPVATWDDLILPSDVEDQLREIVAQVRHRVRVYETWRFGDRSARGRGIAALFAGPSGTGKTLASEVLAGELDVPLFRVDLSAVVSKYVGETEKHLRKLFDACEESGVALYFDECEALFGRRVELRDAHDRYANIEIDYLLQRVEDYRGLVLLGTNRKSDLDGAFLRRLRFLVDFPFPDPRQRARIWRLMFPAEAPRDELDFERLAELELSGGSIRNVTLNAAFRAAEADSPIGMDHIRAALAREYRKLGRSVPRVDRRTKRREKKR